MKKVFVLGSINKDYFITTERTPKIGETVVGYNFKTSQGGKGANQALATKRLGAKQVYMIASVGSDEVGISLINELEKASINTLGMQVNDGDSGSCIITIIEELKNNSIILNKGANEKLDINKALEFLKRESQKGDIFITQFENQIEAVYEGLKCAKELGLYTILNPAPACKFNEDYYKYVDLIIPNETESLALTGIDILKVNDKRKVYDYFAGRGVKEVIVTLGSNGSIYFNNKETKEFGIEKVKVVDTTSAGDTFIGAIASCLSLGKSIIEGIECGIIASAITVSKSGSGESIPTEEEVTHFKNAKA